jgi:prevent-host-death family protein
MAITVSFEEAQANLDELIDRVEAGEVILITRDGRPPVTLSPVVEGTPVDRLTTPTE